MQDMLIDILDATTQVVRILVLISFSWMLLCAATLIRSAVKRDESDVFF